MILSEDKDCYDCQLSELSFSVIYSMIQMEKSFILRKEYYFAYYSELCKSEHAGRGV